VGSGAAHISWALMGHQATSASRHRSGARIIEGLERSHGFQRVLHNFGIELEVVTAAPQSDAVRMTVAAIERQAEGAFFIVQINRRNGDVFTAPPATTVVGEGDGVVLIGRPNRAAHIAGQSVIAP
jgi:voltage-gated potassium channel